MQLKKLKIEDKYDLDIFISFSVTDILHVI